MDSTAKLNSDLQCQPLTRLPMGENYDAWKEMRARADSIVNGLFLVAGGGTFSFNSCASRKPCPRHLRAIWSVRLARCADSAQRAGQVGDREWSSSSIGNRYGTLSITHKFFGERVSDRDVGQARHAAPHDRAAGWSVTLAVQVSAEAS